jgi:ligand-binding sensor domain-containing protein
MLLKIRYPPFFIPPQLVLRTLFFFIITGIGKPGTSQNINFDHFTVEEGLQNNIVFAATQDAKGFMWFGTITGIDRFDGNRFTHYKLPAKNNAYTEFVSIPYLLYDNQKRLWAASSNALFIYNSKLDRFDLADTATKRISASQTTVSALLAGHDGKMWIGLNNNLLLYNPATKAYRQRFHQFFPF